MAPILKFDPLAFETNLFSQIWGPHDCLYGHAFFPAIFRVKVPCYTVFQRGSLFLSFGFSFSYAIYNSILIYAVIYMQLYSYLQCHYGLAVLFCMCCFVFISCYAFVHLLLSTGPLSMMSLVHIIPWLLCY